MVSDTNTNLSMASSSFNNTTDTSYYYDPVDSMVKALLQVYPEAATKREMTFGFLPIHVACASPASLPVIQRLLDVYPDGCKKQDKRGSLPLHMACRIANSPPAIIQLLLRVYPDGAQFQDSDCRLPLHWACHVRSTCEATVASLLHAFPDAAQLSESKYGYLPLHIACKCGASEAVVAHLLAAFPEGSRVRDNMGNLPIHIACGSDVVPVSEGVIGLLLLAFPESLERTDKNGCIPLMVAEQNECYHPRKYAITGLLQSHPAGWRDLAFPIRLKFLEFPSRSLEKKFMAAIQRDHEAQQSSWLSTNSGTVDDDGDEAEEQDYYEGDISYHSHGDKEGYETNDWRARNHYQLRRLSNNVVSAAAAIRNNKVVTNATSEEQPVHHLSECFDTSNDYSVEEDTNEVRDQPAVAGAAITSSSATTNGTSQIVKCVLCGTEPVRYILYPCGHPCLCEDCAETKLANLDHICPVGGCYFQDLILVHGTIVGS
jgi:ankyrin repeat protein